MDVTVLISNCPQLNNPCNAYNPTPIRVMIWDKRVNAFAHPRDDPSRNSSTTPGRPGAPIVALMFNKVLIANRGAIACRILRTLKRLGIRSVAVYSDADRNSAHVRSPTRPYCSDRRRQRKVICAGPHHRGRTPSGAQAIHPGYGFLSENAAFAEACEQAGIVFIGPTPAQMRDFGLKHTARALAQTL